MYPMFCFEVLLMLVTVGAQSNTNLNGFIVHSELKQVTIIGYLPGF